jgi:formylglycine-generating enzyme required for sulfatase activity
MTNRILFSVLFLLATLSGYAQDKPQNRSIGESDIGITWVFVEGDSSRGYYISATEVTFEQFDMFCDATGYEKPKAAFGRGKQPVINVNVADAVAFCTWLSKETGTTIRLPEENEWEYAAKGGTKGNGYKYSGSNSIDEVGWYLSNSGKTTHEVATKEANELGIYDMSGNVWEWCGTLGAVRGGSWENYDDYCRISNRIVYFPGGRITDIGFRVLQKK